MAPFAGMRGERLSWGIGLVAGLSFFLFGYDQGDMGSLLTYQDFRNAFPQIDTLDNPMSDYTALIQGVTVGAWNIGCFVSAILTVFWGDVIGRKNTIFLGLSFLMIGEVIQCTSFSFGQFIAGRCVAGFGNGFTTSTVPAWQAECTKAHRRGTLLMISAGACIAAGVSFSYWIGFAFSYYGNDNSWRIPIAIQLAFAAITLLALVPLPESPRWLILTGREERALQTLSALNDLEPDNHQVRSEFLAIKDAVVEMAGASFKDAFEMGETRHLHRTILAVLLQIFQQITGVNLIIQYFPLMLIQQYGYSDDLARLLAACGGTWFFLSSFIAVVGIDRFWGRRSLMIFGASGMTGSMIVLCIMAYVDIFASQVVSAIFLYIFLFFFAVGWSAMSWLYAVEVVPLRTRGPVNALSTALNWAVNYTIVLVTPLLFHRIGWRTYIIFACTNFVIIPIVWLFYPETGFRSLEEVDVIFYNAALSKSPWLDVRKIAATQPLWYGKDGDEVPFNYEDTEWHHMHVHDVTPPEKTSVSDSRTLTMSTSEPFSKDSSTPSGTSPDRLDRSNGSDAVDAGEDACPSPIVPRLSKDDYATKRSSKRMSWRSQH